MSRKTPGIGSFSGLSKLASSESALSRGPLRVVGATRSRKSASAVANPIRSSFDVVHHVARDVAAHRGQVSLENAQEVEEHEHAAPAPARLDRLRPRGSSGQRCQLDRRAARRRSGLDALEECDLERLLTVLESQLASPKVRHGVPSPIESPDVHGHQPDLDLFSHLRGERRLRLLLLIRRLCHPRDGEKGEKYQELDGAKGHEGRITAPRGNQSEVRRERCVSWQKWLITCNFGVRDPARGDGAPQVEVPRELPGSARTV